jgi:hypothetical protein
MLKHIGITLDKAGFGYEKVSTKIKHAKSKQILASLMGVAVSHFEKGRARARYPEQMELDFPEDPQG